MPSLGTHCNEQFHKTARQLLIFVSVAYVYFHGAHNLESDTRSCKIDFGPYEPEMGRAAFLVWPKNVVQVPFISAHE